MTERLAVGCAAASAALGLLVCGAASAQQEDLLRLGYWNGQLETGYELDRDRSSLNGAPSSAFNYQRSYESATLRNSGFTLVDESVMSGNVSLTLGRYQDRFSDDHTRGSEHGNLLGYGFDSSFHSGTPYTMSIYANRNQSFSAQTFGRTDITIANEGALFRLDETSRLRDWGMPYFSSNLRIERQHMLETTDSVVGQSFRLDQVRKLLNYDGHDGFTTSDLFWFYTLDQNEDQSFVQNNSTTQTAGVNYSLDFGSAHNRRWDSSLTYFHRGTTTAFDSLVAREKVHVDHASNLTSDYFYTFDRIDTVLGSTTMQSGGLGASYRLYNNLTSSMQASGMRESLPSGTIDNQAVSVQESYQRSLPAKGLFTAHLNGGRQWNDNHLTVSSIGIVDEAHGAPNPLGAGNGFALAQPFVSAASIVVVDTRAGARLPTTLGVDYEIISDGQATRIVPLLTSAVIHAGDPLLVSYSYQVDPSIRYQTTPSSVGAGVDFGWIAVNLSHDQANQKLIAGSQPQFLVPYHNDQATLDLRGDWDRVQAQAGAGWQHYDSTILAYVQRRLYQFLSYRPVNSTTISLNGNWTVTDYQMPARQSSASSVRLALDRVSQSGWNTNAMISRRVFTNSLVPTEIVNEASISERILYGDLSLVATVAGGTLDFGATRTTNWRAQITIVRSF